MPVRFAKYTGQEGDTKKREIQDNPPHILLTNYVMLELMLVRPEEQQFVDQSTTALQFLVIDELHTYRGRQGADVALLIRRLRQHCGNPNLLCIGTSATMATGNTRLERRKAVAAFASKLFGVALEPENVVEESLRKVIPASPPTAESLQRVLNEPMPQATWEDLIRNPLSPWIEDTFGLMEEEPGHLRRRTPITLEAGARQLAELTGVAHEVCSNRLAEMLLLGAKVSTPDGVPAFAFKLHQFIAQGGSVFVTLEAPDKRQMTLEGQYYAPGEGDKLLYPLRFCRVCGQEYYAVKWHQETGRLFPDSSEMVPGLDEAGLGEAEAGYLMVGSQGRWNDDAGSFPENWVDKNGNVKRDYRDCVPQKLFAKPTGEVMNQAGAGTEPCWFLTKPFMLCLCCGEAYTRRDREFRKLAQLSSEGRSTATTLLTLSTITTMRRTKFDPGAQKSAELHG